MRLEKVPIGYFLHAESEEEVIFLNHLVRKELRVYDTDWGMKLTNKSKAIMYAKVTFRKLEVEETKVVIPDGKTLRIDSKKMFEGVAYKFQWEGENHIAIKKSDDKILICEVSEGSPTSSKVK